MQPTIRYTKSGPVHTRLHFAFRGLVERTGPCSLVECLGQSARVNETRRRASAWLRLEVNWIHHVSADIPA